MLFGTNRERNCIFQVFFNQNDSALHISSHLISYHVTSSHVTSYQFVSRRSTICPQTSSTSQQNTIETKKKWKRTEHDFRCVDPCTLKYFFSRDDFLTSKLFTDVEFHFATFLHTNGLQLETCGLVEKQFKIPLIIQMICWFRIGSAPESALLHRRRHF